MSHTRGMPSAFRFDLRHDAKNNRDYQSLCTHDEYYLHGTELLHSHLAALVDGMAEFGAKDGAVEDDADHGGDIESRGPVSCQ